MSVQQSDITDLNYDLVLGVSQLAMNGIMKTYYQNSQAYFMQKTFYFIGYQSVDWNYLVQQTGVDPFTIPAWNGQGTMPADIQKCVNANFQCAFRFTPGDPGDPNAATPTFPAWDYNYISHVPNLSTNGPIVFNYTLCCSDFQVVYWDGNANQWVTYTQPATAGSPMSSIVKFAANATLGSNKVAFNPSDYTVPSDVKTAAAALQANNISFSIQEILFLLDDLETSPQASLPFMPTITDTYFQMLGPNFCRAYAQSLQTSFKNQPVLCYALPQTNQPDQTLLNPTNVQLTMEKLVDANGNVFSNPTAAQTALDSFNYICSINGSTPVPAGQIKWNWFDTAADITGNNAYDGAIAISKYTLGKIFYNQINSYAESNCWVPQISCTNVDGKDSWSFSMTGSGPVIGNPVIDNNGSNVYLIYVYTPQPFTTYGVVNTKDYVTINTEYQLEVLIKDSKTVTVTQYALFTYTISLNGQEAMPGIPLNVTYSEDYTVSVLPTGTLVFTAGTPVIDKQRDEGLVPYLTDAESVQLQQAITNTESNMQSAGLTATPLGSAQQVIFPGGTVFSFYDVQFTPSHDLACKINYVKTTANPA